MILFLRPASIGAGACLDSVSVYYFGGCPRGPYFLFCTVLRRAPAPHIFLTFSRRTSGHFSFFTSLLICFVQAPPTHCCSHHHLSPAARTTIYPLPQSFSSNLCYSCHHLPPAAITVTDYLLQSLPPVICCRYHRPPPRALFIADVIFYTKSARGIPLLLAIRLY